MLDKASFKINKTLVPLMKNRVLHDGPVAVRAPLNRRLARDAEKLPERLVVEALLGGHDDRDDAVDSGWRAPVRVELELFAEELFVVVFDKAEVFVDGVDVDFKGLAYNAVVLHARPLAAQAHFLEARERNRAAAREGGVEPEERCVLDAQRPHRGGGVVGEGGWGWLVVVYAVLVKRVNIHLFTFKFILEVDILFHRMDVSYCCKPSFRHRATAFSQLFSDTCLDKPSRARVHKI